jgi:hypothetical protein
MRFEIYKLKNHQVFFIYFFLCLVLFFSTLQLGFLSDDWHWLYLAKNTPLDWQIFLANYEGTNLGGSYNPILLLLFQLAYSLFALQGFFYHLLSLLLHSLNAFLVYLVANSLFKSFNFSHSKAWSWLTGLLFLLWPTQVEAISWLAAWPHLWVTMFYLAAFYFYLQARLKLKNKFLFLSLLFFSLAIFTKELALTLPFLLLAWELYFYLLKNHNKQWWKISFYFIILAGWFFLRFVSTKLFFGYYGESNLNFNFYQWLGNLFAYLNDFFTWSFLREFFYKVYYHGLSYILIFGLIILAIYFYLIYLYKKWWQIILFASASLVLLPLLPLGLSRINFGGERYLYLASAFLLILFVGLLKEIFKSATKKFFIFLFVLLFLILPSVIYKNFIWSQAGILAKQMILSYQDLALADDVQMISVGLPDNLNGAEVFRNNLQQALELSYPNYRGAIRPLPVYVFVSPANKDQKLLKWRTDNLGWFAESLNGKFVLTGKTSIVVEEVYFELWNYNYQNYTANLVRLMPEAVLKEQLLNNDIKWLTFDQGRLRVY